MSLQGKDIVQKEFERRRLRFVPACHVNGDDRVAEFGLIGDAHRSGRVEARHAAQTDAREAGHRAHGGRQRRIGIADIRSEADVGPDRPAQRAALPR